MREIIMREIIVSGIDDSDLWEAWAKHLAAIDRSMGIKKG